MKRFSLVSSDVTDYCDGLVVRLLRRLCQLEELRLRFNAGTTDNNWLIDGQLLHNEVVAHLPHLKQFQFSLISRLDELPVPVATPSKDDVQRSFAENGLGPVEYDTRCHPVRNEVICHVYSLPYAFDVFKYLRNGYNRRDDFSRVTMLVMFGYASFEHGLFANIAEDFPRLMSLEIQNMSRQKLKKHRGAIEPASLITFPRFERISLVGAGIDYLEQFLVDRNTSLPRFHDLEVYSEDLVKLTDNFTSDAARHNCSQVNRFTSHGSFTRPASFYAYFPRL